VRVAFASDEETAVTAAWVGHLRASGHTVMFPVAGAAWPEVGREILDAFLAGSADAGEAAAVGRVEGGSS